MRILFFGDYHWNNNIQVCPKLDNLIKSSDYVIFNLEGPLIYNYLNIDSGEIQKFGPKIKNDPIFFNKIFKYKNIIVAGANNHICDYGEEGIKETINFLNKQKINFFGFGDNYHNASKPIIINDEIAIFNFAENEFGAANYNSYGFSNYNKNIIDKIKEFSKTHKIIVYFHGGTENLEVPNPFIRKLFLKLLNYCVAIIGSHPHIPQSCKIINEKLICYSLGNFIFEPNKLNWKNIFRKIFFREYIPHNQFWDYSLAIEINFEKKISFKEYRIKNNHYRLEIIEDVNFDNHMFKIDAYNDEEIEKIWTKWCSNIKPNYMKYFNYNFLKNTNIARINFNQCESHLEVLKTIKFL